MNISELAQKLANECIVNRVLARYFEMMLTALYEDEIKPLRDALKFIRKKATDHNNPQIAFVADKALKGEKLSSLRADSNGELS